MHLTYTHFKKPCRCSKQQALNKDRNECWFGACKIFVIQIRLVIIRLWLHSTNKHSKILTFCNYICRPDLNTLKKTSIYFGTGLALAALNRDKCFEIDLYTHTTKIVVAASLQCTLGFKTAKDLEVMILINLLSFLVW